MQLSCTCNVAFGLWLPARRSRSEEISRCDDIHGIIGARFGRWAWCGFEYKRRFARSPQTKLSWTKKESSKFKRSSKSTQRWLKLAAPRWRNMPERHTLASTCAWAQSSLLLPECCTPSRPSRRILKSRLVPAAGQAPLATAVPVAGAAAVAPSGTTHHPTPTTSKLLSTLMTVPKTTRITIHTCVQFATAKSNLGVVLNRYVMLKWRVLETWPNQVQHLYSCCSSEHTKSKQSLVWFVLNRSTFWSGN